MLKNAESDLLGADYYTTDGVQMLDFGEMVSVPTGYANGGHGGSRYQYMGNRNSVDLGTADYSDLDYWLEESVAQQIPEGMNVTKSDSMAVGGVVVRNDVRSSVDAHLLNSEVTAGTVRVSADEQATIKATNDSVAKSAGGSPFTSGKAALAVNATIATNLLLSSSTATITNSKVTTTGCSCQHQGDNHRLLSPLSPLLSRDPQDSGPEGSNLGALGVRVRVQGSG